MVQIIKQPSVYGQAPGEEFGNALGSGLQQLANMKMQLLHQRQQQQQRASVLAQLGLPRELAGLPDKQQLAFITQYLQSPGGSADMGQEDVMGGGVGALGAAMPQAQQPALAGLQPQMGQPQAAQQPQMPQQPARKAVPFAQQIRGQKGAQDKIDKETQKYYEKVNREAASYPEREAALQGMEELIKSGELTGPLATSFIEIVSEGIPIPATGKAIKLDLTSLLSPQSQKFKVLQKEFLKNAKDIFGSRVTNQDVNLMLGMIPSLTQSDEGKVRVINSIRALGQASQIRRDVMNQIIEENGGRRPRHLETLVEKRAKPQLDALADKFTEGFDKKAYEAIKKVQQQRTKQHRIDVYRQRYGKLGGAALAHIINKVIDINTED